MGVKGKVKHKDNVVYLFGHEIVWFVHGFKKLAERVELPVDVLFMMVMELSINGLIQPVALGKPGGRLRLKFRVARDLREARELRRNMIEMEPLTPEEFERLRDIREGLFGPIPEELRR
ncbi:hypothetical protein ES703_48925 [subsurface metagenome]